MSGDYICPAKHLPSRKLIFLFHFLGPILTLFAPVSTSCLVWKTLPPSAELAALAREKEGKRLKQSFMSQFFDIIISDAKVMGN